MEKKRAILRKLIPVLYLDDLRLTQYGFSIYREIVIAWDEDYDTQILDAIDAMPAWAQNRLLAAWQCEGNNIGLIWRDQVPEAYQEGDRLGSWSILESRVPDEC